MDFILETVNQLNWWAVLVATLVPFPIGFVWYDMKVGFGKKWAKLVGLKKSDIEKADGMAATFAVLALFAFATAFVLACLMKALGVEGLLDSVVFGVIVGVILRGGAHFIHNGFARRPMNLTLLDVGHDMVSLVAMTVILGLWV
jgi:hypothetical protein